LSRRLFALDHNFPVPILSALSASIPEAELVPIGHIDKRLTDIEDWELLLALHLHPRGWDGLITTDTSLLSLPRELTVIMVCKLTIVAPVAAGHDPLRATGLLLTHLPYICAASRKDVAQVWKLNAKQRPSDDPWELMRSVAERQKREAKDLFQETKDRLDFTTDPLLRARDDPGGGTGD